MRRVLSILLLTFTTAIADDIDFNRDIRPVLSDNCIQCHGPDEAHRKAKLRLDVETDTKADRDGSRVIDPGKPESSLIMERLLSHDPDDVMPPPESGKSVTPGEIEQIRQWIAGGAKWSAHWAYVAPVRHPVPSTESPTSNWIDAFIRDRLRREGVQPSPEAAPVTLVRRLTFDLTGLPPTPEEVAAFAADASPAAYEKAVDRLLGSDRFGERMAAYWLDLVRFADTVGYHGDQDHRITPYRDYVIDAFNDNLPFDQFTREQLAGDLLPDSGIDQKIASGYNRLLQTSHEGGVQPKEYLAIYAADRVRNVSAVWMGATVGCAQCHNHKYDPYTARNFYEMSAFFADVDDEAHFKKGTNSLPTSRPPELKVHTKREREKLTDLDQRIAASAGDPAKQEELRMERERIDKAARQTMVTVALDEPRVTRVLPRGNWLDETGEIVAPATPSFLPGTIASAERGATRLDLANWLTDPKGYGPFTARVFANRFWYLFYGEGLSRSLADFGGQGEPPSHPELLDNLAIEFLESDWDVKKLVRLLVTSQTYKQSSLVPPELASADPTNVLFARQARYRLPAEMIRDNALAVSGLLVLDYGGASVKPYQPNGYYRHLNFPVRTYKHDQGPAQWRRGVYVHWQRQFLHPMLKAFDAPSREECTARRPRSNTPTAALTLLNAPEFVEAARVFAARLLDEESSDNDRIDRGFQLALSRLPDTYERDVATRLLAEQRQWYAQKPNEALAIASAGQAPASERPAHEIAAWTGVARLLLNLDETVSRY